MAAVVHVDAVDDPRLADYVSLRDVRLRTSLEVEHGLFLAEGEKVVRRAVAAGYRPRSFLMAPRWVEALADVLDDAGDDVPCFVAPEPLIESVTGFHVHRGALASLHRRALPDLAGLLAGASRVVVLEDLVDHTNVSGSKSSQRTRSRIAVLEDFTDHGNVGASFRSAAALGIDAVLVTPRCADPLYRRSIKVSMGTVFQVPWTRIDPWPDGIQLLKDVGYVVAGMSLGEDAITLDELVAQDHPKLALLFGTEGHGLSAKAGPMLDVRVKIPMSGGVDSLNVAASSAVAFYATR
ncbi:TrmH family RNA methyltransferase [Jiangella asiatica]|uniref:RNA methyltransferase n=1 Tax=Jiangella asiatica TaxID=2530372 RepID=A0A4R5DHH2_9ACTN|nr:RNA methyltransferase [Jiangella asiatica]TDE09943.1 RNA methyltransferase [Jiangella asiatica]